MIIDASSSKQEVNTVATTSVCIIHFIGLSDTKDHNITNVIYISNYNGIQIVPMIC